MSMDFLRQIVSGPKHRYKEDGYNLDLTYITPRIIAMAYPAEGIQKFYRNSIDAVAQLLNKRHHENYQIINVSGREINSSVLSNIVTFFWEDHKTPQFQELFKICEVMLAHLLKSPQKVTVVHCNHGKGRTGTLICCFLLYTGFFENPDEAMRYYAKKRFETEGYGVTQPCQIQYIRYFSELLKRPKMYPTVTSIYKIELRGQHELKDPYFKLKYVKDGSFIFNTTKEICETLEVQIQKGLTVRLRNSPFFFGDVVLEVKHQPIMGKRNATNFSFNTAFVSNHVKMLEVRSNQFSPLSSIKSGMFDNSFKIKIYFKHLCACAVTTPLPDRCEKCLQHLKGKRIEEWEAIYQILDRKPKIESWQILYGEEKGTRQEEVEKERTKTY